MRFSLKTTAQVLEEEHVPTPRQKEEEKEEKEEKEEGEGAGGAEEKCQVDAMIKVDCGLMRKVEAAFGMGAGGKRSRGCIMRTWQ